MKIVAMQHCGVDLGGTKCALGIVDPDSAFPHKKLKSFHQFTSLTKEAAFPLVLEKDREAWLDYLCSNISDFLKKHLDKADDLEIGFGSPGKFVRGCIVSETAPQFGPALNNFNFSKAILARLQEQLPGIKRISIQNDALAQFAFGIRYFQSTQELSGAIPVGYVGPGTGLGGGFAELSGKSIQFKTDGHIGDLKLSTGETAEVDLISGMAIQNLFGVSGENLAENPEKNSTRIRKLGENLAKLMMAFRTGQYTKTRETTIWSEDEKNWVRSVKTYILGGSILTRPPLSTLIIEECQRRLREEGLEIRLLPLPGISSEGAVIGASILPDCLTE